MGDQSWRQEADCIGVDPQIFFVSDSHIAERKKALAYCKGCSVRLDCLQAAIASDDQYIRGGTTYEERKKMSLLMLALTPISSSSNGLSHNSHLVVEHTVQVEIHTSHTSILAQFQSVSIPPFELNQSVLGVLGIQPLSETLHSPEVSDFLLLPSVPSFSSCLVA